MEDLITIISDGIFHSEKILEKNSISQERLSGKKYLKSEL